MLKRHQIKKFKIYFAQPIICTYICNHVVAQKCKTFIKSNFKESKKVQP